MPERQFFISPVYIICGGRNLSDLVATNTAVICLLSSAPAISTHVDPYLAYVQLLTTLVLLIIARTKFSEFSDDAHNR